MVQALILSRLDYCNSLLVGIPHCHLSHLQHIQNMACRVMCNLRKYAHVTASLKTEHWIRVRECISYKIASLVHQCKMGSAPQYLVDLLPTAIHNCSLRSLTSGNLQPARFKSSLAKEGHLVQQVQKSGTVYYLISELRSSEIISSRLKTHLFGHSYPT